MSKTYGVQRLAVRRNRLSKSFQATHGLLFRKLRAVCTLQHTKRKLLSFVKRGMIDAFQDTEARPQFQKDMGYTAMRQIAVVVVNSRSLLSTDWEHVGQRAPHRRHQTAQRLQEPADPFCQRVKKSVDPFCQRVRKSVDPLFQQIRKSVRPERSEGFDSGRTQRSAQGERFRVS